MDWHSILRKKRVRAVVPITGLACCWLLLNAVAAEGGRMAMSESPVRQYKSAGHVSVDLLGAGADRQWASYPQGEGAASSGTAGQPVQTYCLSTLDSTLHPIARLKGRPVWRF